MTPKQKLWAAAVHAWLHKRENRLHFEHINTAEDFYDANKKAIDGIFYEMRADLEVGVTRGMYDVLIWGIESYLAAEHFLKREEMPIGFIKYVRKRDGD